MTLILSLAARRQLATMPKRERSQILARLQAIAAAPAVQHPGVKALVGDEAGCLRVRQGDWRAVFTIEANGDVVVDRIAHRGRVYR